MKRVYVSPGCISCGTCEALCPEVFEVKDTAQVKPTANLQKYDAAIREAADICPIQAIKIEEE
jgi:ferredoxin